MAEFTEQQVYEALGLGEQEQEVAAPAAEQDEEGQPERELTEPDAEAENEHAAQALDSGKAPLTAEQRRQNAAMRRQQEDARRQTEIDQAVQAALQQERQAQDQAMAAFFAQAGLKDSFTGENITSLEQFNAWNKKYNDAKLQRELKAGKLTPEGLEAAINAHPVVRQAQRLIQQDAAAKQAQEAAAAKARIEGEIQEIHKLDESINSLEDLAQTEYWPQLYEMTKRGYSIKDAHYLLNHERLEKAKLEAAKQQGMMNARGKDHMAPAGVSRGSGSFSVPAAELAMFRQFNPGASDAEIQAYYNKYKRE